jgi:antitoxin component of MazEF toxin-antitoxin module
MVKTLSRIGNSQGIIFDTALLELTHLKAGDQVNVEVHEGGTITLSPIRPRVGAQEFADTVSGVVRDYAATLKKLA